jgi:hypothetical protein
MWVVRVERLVTVVLRIQLGSVYGSWLLVVNYDGFNVAVNELGCPSASRRGEGIRLCGVFLYKRLR